MLGPVPTPAHQGDRLLPSSPNHLPGLKNAAASRRRPVKTGRTGKVRSTSAPLLERLQRSICNDATWREMGENMKKKQG